MQQNMIIYISKATRVPTAEEVARLARASAENNRNTGITGLLLQIGNYFVQVLEGQPQILSAVLRKIDRDERHTGLCIIYQKAGDSKLFTQWNMGYFNIEQYYQANRLDIHALRHYVEEIFTKRATSKEAIVQLIRSMPVLMQSWQIQKPDSEEVVVSSRQCIST